MATVRIRSRPTGVRRMLSLAQRHETIGFQGAQPLQFGREVTIEANAMPALDGRFVDAAVTHDLVNDVLAQHIVVVHAHAAMRRKRAGCNRTLVVCSDLWF